MRKLIALAVVVVALIVAVVLADQLAERTVESSIASRIERRVPGSHAVVTIKSSPFLVRVAASGTVETADAHVTGVKVGGFAFDSVDVDVHNLRISRSALLHGSVRVVGLSRATITATIPTGTVAGVIGGALSELVSGLNASVNAGPHGIQIGFGPLSFTLPHSSIIPCVGSAAIRGADVVLTCTTTSLPPVLQNV